MVKKWVLKIAGSAIFLAVLLYVVDLRLLYSSLLMADLRFIALAGLLVPVGLLIRSYRLRMLLHKNRAELSIWDSLRINFVGLALNTFLPASSGDIAKAYYGYRKYRLKEVMLSSVLVDKMVAILAILVIGVISALALGLMEFALPFALLTAMAYIFSFHPGFIPWRMLNRLLGFFTGKSLEPKKLAESMSMPPRLKAEVLGISIVAWGLTYLQFYLLCMAFSADAGVFYILAMAPLITLARLFPLTLSGFGSQEVVVVYLFGLINIQASVSLLISLLFTIINLVIPGLAGFLLFMWRDSHISSREP